MYALSRSLNAQHASGLLGHLQARGVVDAGQRQRLITVAFVEAGNVIQPNSGALNGL